MTLMSMPFEFHPIEQILLGLMIFLFMFAIGAGLHLQDFKRSLVSKKTLLVGLLSQYAMMPLLALMMSSLFSLSSEMTVILLIIGVAPGGTSSNMFTFLSRGNVSLSVTLTLISSLLAVIISPLLLSLYSQHLNLSIPFKNIAMTLFASLLPILMGMILRINYLDLAIRLEFVARKLGLLVVLVMIGLWVPKILGLFDQGLISVFLSIGLMSGLGMALAYVISWGMRLKRLDAITISFETGIQNAPLAFAIIGLSFAPDSEIYGLAWIALVYGALSVANGLFALSIHLFCNYFQAPKNTD
jgi:predicted Na+-dependent transporter